MDRVFSVEELSDKFWPPPPATSAAGGGGWGPMNRIPSERLFENFLAQEASVNDTHSLSLPPYPNGGLNFDHNLNPNPNPNPSSDPSGSSAVSRNFSSTQWDGGIRGEEEVVEIKKPQTIPAVGPVQSSSSDRKADVDPEQYAAILKEKLDMYCHAVAIARGSVTKPQDSFLADSRLPALDYSQPGPQAPISGGGLNGVAALSAVQSSGLQARPATSSSSREQSDDDDLEGETEMTDNMDPADVKRVRRMLSNRESARRSRRRKQAHLSELEAQVSQLRVENSALLKRLTDINQKYSEASVDNRILKADVETLRAKFKMAEDSLKHATGVSPMFPTMPNMSSIGVPFKASPPDATSDAAVPVQDDPNLFFQATPHNWRSNSATLPEIAPPADHVVRGATATGKIGRTASMQRVASLEHLQKRICGTPAGSCSSSQWDPVTWDHEFSGNEKYNRV